MPKFTVMFHKSEKEKKNEYFTPQNEIVGQSAMGVWGDFDAANKAAVRARIQDTSNRRVSVEEI